MSFDFIHNFFLSSTQSGKEKDIKSIWLPFNQREKPSDETLYDSDTNSLIPDSSSYDLDIEDCDLLFGIESKESIKYPATPSGKFKKLQIAKLDSISISSAAAQAHHIVNLQQSFNFTTSFKSSKVMSTQTSKMDLTANHLLTSEENNQKRRLSRPASLPPENAALVNLEKRVQAEVLPKIIDEMIGDGDKNIADKSQGFKMLKDLWEQDLEISGSIPTPVHCVTIKPK